MLSNIRTSIVFATLAVALAIAAPVAGQESLQQVKDLYANAAYEDALGVLSRLPSSGQRLEIERYRVFCLIALDRTAEAEKAIAGILAEDPLYKLDEASPRVMELFNNVKRQSTPQLAKALYAEGKAAMDKKDNDLAVRKFEQMLQLTDDPAIRESTLVSELRLLAGGFLDLTRTPSPAPATPERTVSAPAPAAATPPSPAGDITPAFPLRQELPKWVPYDATTRSTEYRGAVKVTISTEGKVEAAEIVTPTDRQYDRLLLNAARSWLYEPARRNGMAIQSEKVVSIYLRPK
ncbi:MAG: energy transducer TonB [Vicinamibacterales bacterium]